MMNRQEKAAAGGQRDHVVEVDLPVLINRQNIPRLPPMRGADHRPTVSLPPTTRSPVTVHTPAQLYRISRRARHRPGSHSRRQLRSRQSLRLRTNAIWQSGAGTHIRHRLYRAEVLK